MFYFSLTQERSFKYWVRKKHEFKNTRRLLIRVVFTEGNDAAESGGWDVGETIRVSGEQRVVDSRGGRQRNPLPPPALGDPGDKGGLAIWRPLLPLNFDCPSRPWCKFNAESDAMNLCIGKYGRMGSNFAGGGAEGFGTWEEGEQAGEGGAAGAEGHEEEVPQGGNGLFGDNQLCLPGVSGGRLPGVCGKAGLADDPEWDPADQREESQTGRHRSQHTRRARLLRRIITF